tara:strand:- start:1457 stop:2068 length:612 start_codon:yes stop_codon:yes gene_type:complete
MKTFSREIRFTIAAFFASNLSFASQEETNLESEPETISGNQVGVEINNSLINTTQDSDRPIEEIQVLGSRTLYSIRMEIVDEENRIFSMFNELNSDDDFDILCDNIAPTGSHIKQRVCEPRFVTETRARMAQDFMLGIGALNESSDLGVETKLQQDELEKEHLRIAAEYPEYLEMLTKLMNLRATLEARKDDQWSRWRELFDN